MNMIEDTANPKKRKNAAKASKRISGGITRGDNRYF